MMGVKMGEECTFSQSLVAGMFGGFMNFTWNKVTKKLTLVRKIPWAGIQGSKSARSSRGQALAHVECARAIRRNQL
jgi:hypothetical protein